MNFLESLFHSNNKNNNNMAFPSAAGSASSPLSALRDTLPELAPSRRDVEIKSCWGDEEDMHYVAAIESKFPSLRNVCLMLMLFRVHARPVRTPGSH